MPKTTVLAFPLHVAWRQLVEMPAGAQLLHVDGPDRPDGHSLVYARVDVTAPVVARRIVIARSGDHLDPELVYVGTFHVGASNAGPALHVFDGGAEALAAKAPAADANTGKEVVDG